MKILFTAMRFRRDGFATNVLELAQGLVERGHELHIITSGFLKSEDSKDDAYFKTMQTNLKDWGVHMHYFKEPKGNPLKKAIMSIFGTLQVLYLIQKINADVIHAQSPNTTLFPWLLRKKFISTVHTDTIRPNFAYKHPDILIAVSTGSKEFTERVMGSNPKSVRIVHHGISERFAEEIKKETIKDIKERHNIPQDKIVVGFVGRLVKAKGLDVLIEAVAYHLSEEVRKKLHLVMVGHYDNPTDEQWLMNLIKEGRLENQYHILPFQDPRPMYQLFDVFALPSRIDTFGLVAVEAMMSGCCTIRANSYGATDQIDHAENGYIFQMDAAQELAQYLDEVVRDPEVREQIGKAGKKKALEHFTKDKMVDKTIALYEELKTM